MMPEPLAPPATDDGGLNLRYELRAYETADACRAAHIVQALSAAADSPNVSRMAVAEEWGRRYPRHLGVTGRQRIARRVGNGLGLLCLTGALRSREYVVQVADAERLRMAAANLAIVEDADGVAVRPSAWPRRPEAPAHLLAVQARLEATRVSHG